MSSKSEDRINEVLFSERVLEPRNIQSEQIENVQTVENPIWEPDNKLVNPILMSYEMAGDFLKSLPEKDRKLCLYESFLNIGVELFNVPYIKGVIDYWDDTGKANELGTLTRFLYERFLIHEFPLNILDCVKNNISNVRDKWCHIVMFQ